MCCDKFHAEIRTHSLIVGVCILFTYHPYLQPEGQIAKGTAQTELAECILKDINDPGAQQPSQMLLISVKVRPQHRELLALLFTDSVWVP